MQRIRYLIIFAAWFALIAFFQLRVNINVAIMEIAKDIDSNNNLPNNSIDLTTTTKQPTTQKFKWNKLNRAQLLASFFYGYAATQFIGSLVASYFGPRITISCCLFMSSLFILITPVIERFGPIALTFDRLILGLLSGPLFPCINSLVGAWIPVSERTFINSVTHSGNLFGITLGYVVGGIMCNSPSLEGGWKYYFYFSGGFTLLAFVIWTSLIYDTPDDHPYIITKEKNYIQCSTYKKIIPLSKSFRRIPFKKLFTSLQVWLLTLALFGHLSIFFCLLTNLPMFLRDCYSLSTKTASFYSIIPFVTHFIVLVLYPIRIDYLRNKKQYNVTKLRRFSSAIAFLGSVLFLIPVGYLPTTNPLYVVLMLSISMGFLGCNYSGFLTAVVEIAPKYAAITIGINNTFASCTGFIITIISGALLKHQGVIIGWRNTFIFVGVFVLLCGAPFVLFGSSEPQEWATDGENNVYHQTPEITSKYDEI